MKNLIVTSALVCILTVAKGQVISDPVADFLSLPIEDRYTDASEVVEIHKVSIDLDLDGQSELLVGHHKMWWGDNHGIYFAIYRKLPNGGYKRLTKATEDIGLDFRDGRPEYNFVGRIDELSDTGLLICNPPQGDAEFGTKRVVSRMFVSIAGDVVRVRELPGLDLSKESDLAFYRKYFPLAGKQGGYASESLKPDDIKALGLVLPDWTKPIRLEANGTVKSQSALNVSSTDIDESRAPKKEAEAKQATSNEQDTSSTPWSMIVVSIMAVGGLLWLMLKRRS